TMLLNEMSRAMGQPDFYPFVLPHEVVAKLQFIHLVVSAVNEPSGEPVPDSSARNEDAGPTLAQSQWSEQVTQQMQAQQGG
ncbi:MAG: putative zinc-binding metallopeptidase, partial [Pseudomonadota bacterium]